MAGAIAVLLAATVGGVLAGSAPARALDGLATTATTTYTIDFPAGVVRARIDLSLENTGALEDGAPSPTSFTGIELGVQGDATAVVATSGGGPVDTLLTPVDEDVQVLALRFPDPLRTGDRLDATVTYDLPGLPPRSERPWRANEAFTAFVAYTYGDPRTSALRIVTPPGTDLDLLDLPASSPPQVTRGGDSEIRTFVALEDPGAFAPVVIAADDAALAETALDVDGRPVVLQAWPDDAEWAGFVGGQITAGLLELERLIGLPIRDDRRLTVRQSVQPLLHGFAGWYDPIGGVIELGEELDPGLMLHELGHSWFNEDLTPSRWIGEGLAETYANLALEATSGAAAEPETPASQAAGGQPLDEWEHPGGMSLEDAAERYGYATSWFVVDALIDEIGTDAMADVLAAAEDDLEAYRGDDEPAAVPHETDWRRFLDIVEEVGGSVGATELFRTYVVSSADLTALDDRTAARRRYDALVADGTGWAAPIVVRVPMEAWNFESAGPSIDAADGVLAARDELDTAAAAAGITVPTGLERRYETAETQRDLDALEADVAELQRAIDAVASVDAASRELTGWGLLGLDGERFDDDLEAARSAIADGDAAGATALATDVGGKLSTADETGRRRAATLADTAVEWRWLGAVLAGLIGVGVGVVIVIAAGRAGRRGSRRVGSDVDARRDAPVDGDVEVGVGRRVDLDEDALAGAGFGGVDDRRDVAEPDLRQGAGPARVVERSTVLLDVGDPVLELHEDVRAVVDAEAVAGAEVLVDPDAHGRPER